MTLNFQTPLFLYLPLIFLLVTINLYAKFKITYIQIQIL